MACEKVTNDLGLGGGLSLGTQVSSTAHNDLDTIRTKYGKKVPIQEIPNSNKYILCQYLGNKTYPAIIIDL